MELPTDRPILSFPTRDAFARWLEEEHARAPGIWLKLAKKGTRLPSITYVEAVEVARALVEDRDVRVGFPSFRYLRARVILTTHDGRTLKREALRW